MVNILSALWYTGLTLVASIYAVLMLLRCRKQAAGRHVSLLEMLTRSFLSICVVCGILTALLLLILAWGGVVIRGGSGITEGGIAAQSALYAALPAWGLAWLDTRIKFRWRPMHRGPKLLPPVSSHSDEE